jgi:hypothetical protein
MVVPYQLRANTAATAVSAQEVAAAAAPWHIVLQQGRASSSQRNDIVEPRCITDRQTDRENTLILVELGNLKWFLQVNIFLSELITSLMRMSYNISWPPSSFLWPSTSLIGLLCFASFRLAIQTQKTSHSVPESDPSTASVSSIDPYPSSNDPAFSPVASAHSNSMLAVCASLWSGWSPAASRGWFSNINKFVTFVTGAVPHNNKLRDNRAFRHRIDGKFDIKWLIDVSYTCVRLGDGDGPLWAPMLSISHFNLLAIYPPPHAWDFRPLVGWRCWDSRLHPFG